MTEPVGTAVVGAGAWGNLAARRVAVSSEVTLAGIVDRDEARRDAVAESLGVPSFPSIDAAMECSAVEAVLIALPNSAHATAALAAIESRKHVLIEKPMTLTVIDAVRVAQAAAKQGVVLMVDHIQRCFSPLVELKALVDNGFVGRIVGMNVSRCDLLFRRTPWLQKRDAMGGILYQLACHEYDFLRWIDGGEVVSLYCLAGPVTIAKELDYPDLIISQLLFDSGTVAQVWTGQTDPQIHYGGWVTGTEGTVWFDLYRGTVTSQRFGEPRLERRWEPSDAWSPGAWISGSGMEPGEASGLDGILTSFGRAIRRDEPQLVTPEDGLRAVELAQAGYLSIAQKRPVSLPLGGRDRAVPTYMADAASSAVRGSDL